MNVPVMKQTTVTRQRTALTLMAHSCAPVVTVTAVTVLLAKVRYLVVMEMSKDKVTDNQ